MQLDADEDGEPFFKPPAVTSPPLQQREDQQPSSEQRAEHQGAPEQTPEDHIPQAAAATATNETEE